MKTYRIVPKDIALGLAANAEWSDRRKVVTTGQAKHNQEDPNHPALVGLQEALVAHEGIQGDYLPLHILRPLFSRYGPGDHYDWHNDACVISGIRTDVACTLFLSDDYEGGELLIDGLAVKGEPGTCVVYSCWRPHRVMPVTRGERICAVTWMQSLIRDDTRRDLLVTLRKATETLSEEQHKALTPVSTVYNKLMKMWME